MGDPETTGEETDMFPKPVGERLRDARIAQGLEVADIAARTRIPRHHLNTIESSDYSDLPSPTYAMGFAKAYARAVDMDEVAIGRDLRGELDTGYHRPAPTMPYDTSDPVRVPSGGIAVAGLAIAILLLVGIGIWYGTDLFRGEEPVAPEAVPTASAPAAQTAPSPAPTAAAVPASGGQVTLTATDQVWVRIYDADNDTLMMKTMAAGDSYDVPQDADNPMINVGRPGKLTVTINGSDAPPLGPPDQAIKDVGVSATALRARGTP